ncbi:hypothetical protein LSAT2_010053 [Lamellibrachia satsuma]|nr:hypothetical protein LSAT2_010053 [Lamellibrachia satsuma]
MACWTLFTLAVAAFPQVSAFVGKNSITCITFDKLDWEGEPIASNGVWMNNFNVLLNPGGGVVGNSGDFRIPSKLELPYLQGNDFSKFTISVCFKRRFPLAPGPAPVIASNGDCTSKTIQHPQAGNWIHVVVTGKLSIVTGWGWVNVYVNGLPKTMFRFIKGRLSGTAYPLMIGANMCPFGTTFPPSMGNHFFDGQMDFVSIARDYLTPARVSQLYSFPGCVGE